MYSQLIFNSLFIFNSFVFVCNLVSFDYSSINWFVFINSCIQSQSTWFVDCCTPAVHSFTRTYCAPTAKFLILSHADHSASRSSDRHAHPNNTNSHNMGAVICEILYHALTVLLCCFLLFCIILNSILNAKSFLDLTSGRGARIFGSSNWIFCELSCQHLCHRLGILIVSGI